jgi:ComF family protein
MFQRFLDLFFPRVSLGGEEGMTITHLESRRLRSWPVCMEVAELRKRGLRSLDRIVAASTYESSPLLRTAVQRFKYRRVMELRSELSALVISASSFLPPDREITLSPVPLHWSRTLFRGFNQSALLAEDVARAREWKMSEFLRRVRATGHQAHRSRKDRLRAMRGVFAIRNHDVPSYVVLVDDVATTGATLDACASILKRHGAERVDALVIATG